MVCIQPVVCSSFSDFLRGCGHGSSLNFTLVTFTAPRCCHAPALAMESAVRSLLRLLSEGGDEQALGSAFEFIEDELPFVHPTSPEGNLLFSQETADLLSKALDVEATALCATAALHQLLLLVAVTERERTVALVSAPNVLPRLVNDLKNVEENVFVSASAARVLAALAENGYATEVTDSAGLLEAVCTALSHGLQHEPSSEDTDDEGQTQRSDVVKPSLALLVALAGHSTPAKEAIAAHATIPNQVVDVACMYGSHKMVGEFYSMLEYIESLLQMAGTATRLIGTAMPQPAATTLLMRLKEGLEAHGRGTNANEWNAKARARVLAGVYPDAIAASREVLLANLQLEGESSSAEAPRGRMTRSRARQ